MPLFRQSIGPSKTKHNIHLSRVEQRDNWLQVTFNVIENESYDGDFTKPEFIINESVAFQISISKVPETKKCMVHVKFIRLREKDKTSYTIQYYHTVDGIYKTHKKFSSDDIWHLIETYTNCPAGRTFIMSIQLCDDGDVPSSSKINNKSDKLKKSSKISLVDLYKNENLSTDVILKASDNSGYVSFHMFAIEFVSPQLFKSLNYSVQSKRPITLNRSKATLQHLKDYIYLDKVPETGLEDLLLLASDYKMSDLIMRCINELMKNITSENANTYFELAEKHNISQLKWKILERVQNGTLKLNIPDNID